MEPSILSRRIRYAQSETSGRQDIFTYGGNPVTARFIVLGPGLVYRSLAVRDRGVLPLVGGQLGGFQCQVERIGGQESATDQYQDLYGRRGPEMVGRVARGDGWVCAYP